MRIQKVGKKKESFIECRIWSWAILPAGLVRITGVYSLHIVSSSLRVEMFSVNFSAPL